mmetsp:Transcript_2583/g.3958  ORF Transcript_2583/g.3958 Transcript_2583/m.3958 type:complete len:910 (-) Transcript_2583:84-2813(-)
MSDSEDSSSSSSSSDSPESDVDDGDYWTSESDVDVGSNDDDDDDDGSQCPRCGGSVYDCDCPQEMDVPKDFPLLKVLPEVLSWDIKTLSLDSSTIRDSIARLVYSTAQEYPALTWGEALKVLQIVQWDDSYLPDILQDGKMQNWLTKKNMWPPLKSSTAPTFTFKSDPIAVADASVAASASPADLECPVCDETLPADSFLQAGCGHFFCKECWARHLQNAVTTQGSGSIHTTCMSCKRPVPLDLIITHKLLGDEQLKKLVSRLIDHYLIHSDDDYQMCPQPASVCPVYAVKCQIINKDEIRCKCNAKWCYQCRTKHPDRTESHFPLSCDNYDRWRSLGNDQTIAAGIKLTSKPCPSCNVSISRDLIEGCLHMTCTNCKAHFCWECLQTPFPHGNDSGFFTCPEVEKKRQTEDGNAQYLRQQREKQVATWYNEAFDLHCRFKDAAKQFSDEAKDACDALVARLGGPDAADASASPLVDLMLRGTSARGQPIPGIIIFLRDALEIVAHSVVHTYVEYEMDAEERVREINMLKFHIDRLMIECDHMACAIRAIDTDTIILSGSMLPAATVTEAAGGLTFADGKYSYKSSKPDSQSQPVQREGAVADELRQRLTHADHLLQTLLSCVRDGMKDFTDAGDSKLQAQQQLQWAACQKWHEANGFDRWGNPQGTEYPGGSPCRPGSNSTVFAEARLAKLRGLDRPDWLVSLLFNRVLHPTQPWRIPPFMEEQPKPIGWWFIDVSCFNLGVSGFQPFDKGHNDDIEKTFAFWEAHRTSVFLKQSMERGRASPTHSGGSSPAEASGAGDARGGGSASDASESKEDGDFASYDTKFAGTALQHDSELRVRIVFADNQTLQVLPDSKMYGKILRRCGNIAAGSRVRVQRKLVNGIKRCGFCNAEMPDVSDQCMLCGQAVR